MGSLFGKKSPSPGDELRGTYPLQTQTVVWRFILAVPPDGKPKGGQRAKKSSVFLFDLYKDGEFGLVCESEAPGCFSYKPIDEGLLLANHKWLGKNLYQARYSRDGIEPPEDLKVPGFAVSQVPLEGGGILHFADQGLKKYKSTGSELLIEDHSVACVGRAKLAYDKVNDRLWMAAGTLSKMEGVSAELSEPQEVLPENAYDGIALSGDGGTLYLKNRTRTKQFKMVVNVEVYEVDAEANIERTGTLSELQNPRVFCLDPKQNFVFTGGYSEDPFVRSFKLDDLGSELVDERSTTTGSHEGKACEQLFFHRDLLIAVTEDRLLTFRVSKDGMLTRAAELEQCCLSFLEPIDYP